MYLVEHSFVNELIIDSTLYFRGQNIIKSYCLIFKMPFKNGKVTKSRSKRAQTLKLLFQLKRETISEGNTVNEGVRNQREEIETSKIIISVENNVLIPQTYEITNEDCNSPLTPFTVRISLGFQRFP